MIPKIRIETFSKQDWTAIADIYQKGIDTGIATFETIAPNWSNWDATHFQHCRFKAVTDDKIIGWAALSPVSKRYVYHGVAEVSVYVDPEQHSQGIGTWLLTRLIAQSEIEGIWTLQSSIFTENTSSIMLHKKLGFREIGYREKVGQRNGKWYDNILMEKRNKNII
ncbi:GNAT family N-acetyltransferase [Aquimarina brevivitae]|uniref:Phosphinothricin acetyltransferase n=1 Tax=Aquimarina brevivitae TaxID=323412 RepID=A0A4Q7PF23_9FLAO|nr:GNAT family N-acetyltransferase [Aquimarina brevivitae]RZS99044.1 phosphinothricin acetyltransferase [Aquimarina brevivitae]